MLVKVKMPYFDGAGLHRIGEVIETTSLDPKLHEKAEKVKQLEEIKAPVKAKKTISSSAK